ncbi:DUF221-domain-containing protein, partial [Fistulina hepatica ATCC 64428]
ELPPYSPPTRTYNGPWLSTQLTISFAIGGLSFLIFSFARTRWPLLFSPRTKLKGFSPHEAHAHNAFFGWIVPTIRISEFTVLQIVGLDAAVLLNFFKMSFGLFSLASFFATTILMPLNFRHNKDIEDDTDWVPSREWLDLISDANTYLSVHLLFTYLFTILACWFTFKNYRRFIRTRQLFSLELVHSIPARTVMVTNLPKELRGERPLAEYFERMDLAVESVSVVRQVGFLKPLLDVRTHALLELEKAWVKYVGNPGVVEGASGFTDDTIAPSNLIDVTSISSDVERHPRRLVVPNRKRPTIRPRWFKPKVDALEYLEERFREADEAFRKRRRTSRFRATSTAFVTFEKMSSAEIAVQSVHAPVPLQCTTYNAPEPRDVIWANMTASRTSIRMRDVLVLGVLVLLHFTWFFPIAGLASLLSYEEIKKTLPWLGRLIDSNDNIRALVQNSLPSVAMITLNAVLPFFLEGIYIQGHRARSWIEYSLLKKYFLFLLINVVFIFLLASTYWQLVRDLANSPARIPERVAQALHAGRARNFFLSYVVLQAFGIMPLQLLNLDVVIPRIFMRLFVTRTPRDFAELNAPPMINYGAVYPQAILMFVITMLYSVTQPLIVIFGAMYFGIGYMVYKYKLLFVYYKPYESQGQAWPITFVRLIWGVLIFQIFMAGFFTLKKAYVSSTLLVPLVAGTVLYAWWTSKHLTPLSEFVSLSSVCEVQRGEDSEEVVRLREGHPVTWSQSNLNRRRYAQNDDTLYVAPEDERTDYSQPPMANWYKGVLNTGKRRYGHPALNGVLPEPWLPLKKGQSLVNTLVHHDDSLGPAVVLSLRKRTSLIRKRALMTGGDLATNENSSLSVPAAPHAQSRQTPLGHRLSFDQATGVINLPDDEGWLGGEPDITDDHEDIDSDEELDANGTQEHDGTSPPEHDGGPARRSRYGTYFHHPERRRQSIPGSFP